MLDAIALAEGELSAIGFTPDGVVLNPTDVAANAAGEVHDG